MTAALDHAGLVAKQTAEGDGTSLDLAAWPTPAEFSAAIVEVRAITSSAAGLARELRDGFAVDVDAALFEIDRTDVKGTRGR